MQAFAAAVVSTLVELDGPPAVVGDPAARAGVERFARAQLEAMAAHLRLGVRAIGTVLALVCVAVDRRPFGRLSLERRAAWVARWDEADVPGPSLYTRLLRSLVLFAAYEEATPRSAAPAEVARW